MSGCTVGLASVCLEWVCPLQRYTWDPAVNSLSCHPPRVQTLGCFCVCRCRWGAAPAGSDSATVGGQEDLARLSSCCKCLTSFGWMWICATCVELTALWWSLEPLGAFSQCPVSHSLKLLTPGGVKWSQWSRMRCDPQICLRFSCAQAASSASRAPAAPSSVTGWSARCASCISSALIVSAD